MSWVTVGVGVGTALLGAYQASEQRRAARDAQENANNQNLRIAQAQTQYSPWTGIKPGSPNMAALPVGQSDVGGAVQGGLGGAMFAQGLKQSDAEKQLQQMKAGREVASEFDNMKADPAMYRWAGNRRLNGAPF